MAISFPSSPALNDLYTFSNKTWKYNGYAWDLVTTDLSPFANTSNASFYHANAAFDKANASYGSANTAANSANLYAISVGLASNNYANASFTTIANGISAFNHANAAYDKANNASGGGFFQGNNGDVGKGIGIGDIFRVHTNTLTENVTIHTGNNAIAAGPLTIATGRTLTIQSGSRVVLS